jgi:2-hydroxy-4-carboxymuconate semialdehyde hemiacetal dehydrogenase
MSIRLRTTGGVLCTLALSFNNDGPLGTVFRYIGDTGTYLARYDDNLSARSNAVYLLA